MSEQKFDAATARESIRLAENQLRHMDVSDPSVAIEAALEHIMDVVSEIVEHLRKQNEQ